MSSDKNNAFDGLSRSLAHVSSRRQALKLIGGGIAGGFVAQGLTPGGLEERRQLAEQPLARLDSIIGCVGELGEKVVRLGRTRLDELPDRCHGSLLQRYAMMPWSLRSAGTAAGGVMGRGEARREELDSQECCSAASR